MLQNIKNLIKKKNDLYLCYLFEYTCSCKFEVVSLKIRPLEDIFSNDEQSTLSYSANASLALVDKCSKAFSVN